MELSTTKSYILLIFLLGINESWIPFYSSVSLRIIHCRQLADLIVVVFLFLFLAGNTFLMFNNKVEIPHNGPSAIIIDLSVDMVVTGQD